MATKPIRCNTPHIINGEIIKIIEKKSKYGNIYFDVQFKLLGTGSFYRCCVYTQCRNFIRWENKLKVGNILSNLDLITKYGKTFIDADSFPELVCEYPSSIEKLNDKLSSFGNSIRKVKKQLQESLF